MTKPEDLLEKIPKKTPTWALGLVTIIIAVSTSFLTIYVVSRDEVKQYLGWKIAQEELGVKNYNSVMTSILKLSAENHIQILNLSQSLGAAQQQTFILTERVTALEHQVSSLKEVLLDCQQKLSECERSRKR